MTLNNLIVGFHQPHLSGRGTTHAMLDYAKYNEKILGNKSIIFYAKNHLDTDRSMEKTFNDQFTCFEYNNEQELSLMALKASVDVMYSIKSGEKNGNLPKLTSNAVHAVFNSEPHGNLYAYVSKHLAEKYNSKNYVPHMITLKLDVCEKLSIPDTSSNSEIATNICLYNYGTLRGKLGIPSDVVVIGRYGGSDTFDIPYLTSAILKSLEGNPNLYYIFMGTKEFCQNERVHFLEHKNDPVSKASLILSSDYMIHGRLDGETFGISIGEFSTFNRQIITTAGKFNSHLDILGDKGLIYTSEEELLKILVNLNHPDDGNYNQYSEYNPKDVMMKFKDVFLPYELKLDANILYNKYDNITSSLNENDWKPHMIVIIDLVGSLLKKKGNYACMDIGAHIGLFSIQMCEYFRSLHAFEPDNHHLCLLNRNNNGCQLYINNTALWDNNGNCYIDSNNYYPVMVNDIKDKPSLGNIKIHYAGDQIKGSTIDLYHASIHGDGQNKDNLDIGLIKININGGEYTVLTNGKSVLSKYHPYILFEMNPIKMNSYSNTPKQLMNFLTELDYNVLKFKSKDERSYDYIAVHKPSMEEFMVNLVNKGLKTRTPSGRETVYELPEGVDLIIEV